MDLKLKIYITGDDGKKFMGIGVLWLMQHIRSCGSIKKAAEEMKISYAKAHNMLNTLENQLGKPVLDRQKGGEARTGAQLTPFGLRFIDEYDQFQRDTKSQAENRFSDFLRTLSSLKEEENEPKEV